MNGGKDEKLGQVLNAFYQKQPQQARIKSDPIEFPHHYCNPNDIEVVAFLSALLAYGRISLFKTVLEKILSLTGGTPYRYFSTFNPEVERPRFEGIYYRFTRTEDLVSLADAIGQVIRQHGSLGALFSTHYRESDRDIGPTLSRFVSAFRENLPQPRSPGLSHLLPSPEKGSACKRLNLFLRWMIRPDDGVDFGLWHQIPPAKLMIPLDTHIIRIAGYLGLTRRKSPDWKMAQEITESLKRFDRVDPVRYDFALCHLGISGACPVEFDTKKCIVCHFKRVCGKFINA